MADLQLDPTLEPYTFKSLGNRDRNGYLSSKDFPKGSIYKLKAGKFPLTDYMDMFQNSKKYHIFEGPNGPIKVIITGFNISCQERDLNKYEDSGVWSDFYCTDQSWKELQKVDRWYAFKPTVGIQRSSYSDILKGNVSYGV